MKIDKLSSIIIETNKSCYIQQEGNADLALKSDFYIFLLIFQHKLMFLSTMQTLSNQILYFGVMIFLPLWLTCL